jgi:hypothetical protein
VTGMSYYCRVAETVQPFPTVGLSLEGLQDIWQDNPLLERDGAQHREGGQKPYAAISLDDNRCFTLCALPNVFDTNDGGLKCYPFGF